MAASADIRLLRQPYAAMPMSVTGEGVAASGADLWHSAGYTGRGVRIGILDAGFARYSELLGSELPGFVTVPLPGEPVYRDITGGGQIHGTAVAEIVHETAPDASLVLVNYSNDIDFPAAVAYLRSQGVDLITNSTGSFLWGPGDGTGPVNDAVTAAVQSGVFFSQASGNHAQRHWSGAYADSDGDGWNNFAADLNSNAFSQSVTAGTPIQVELKWDDPYNNACNDFDLYVLDAAFQIVAGSSGWQDCARNPGQHPVEAVSFTAPSTGAYRIAVARFDYAGNPAPRPNARLDLYSFTHELSLRTPAGSLVIPADNAAATTAGAYNWGTPGAIESYSSQGPTLDGRAKPDLVGPDHVSTSPLTFGTFSGTSAAAPHVGAAAALFKQAQPGATPAQIKAFLKGRATDFMGGANNIALRPRRAAARRPSP
ncbi:MAG: S8 family serine peptidase [Chloroflexi bacterium]|nr:S8 family serine peptidase [Chloroflexota bacterium]